MYSEDDYVTAAAKYQVPVAAVKAVIAVEASGEGFLPDGRPKILFEAHHFGRRTAYKFNGSNPDVSVRTWDEAKLLYRGGAREYDRFNEAAALAESAAIESASWGAGQVMGFNWPDLGFSNAKEFVAHVSTAAGQMDVMMRYCDRHNLLYWMRQFPDIQACRMFAAGYNGTGAIDEYAAKLHAAYVAAADGSVDRVVLRRGDKGDEVKVLQKLLGIKQDGDFGPVTERAVKMFQETHDLISDGVVGPLTLSALKKEAS